MADDLELDRLAPSVDTEQAHATFKRRQGRSRAYRRGALVTAAVVVLVASAVGVVANLDSEESVVAGPSERVPRVWAQPKSDQPIMEAKVSGELVYLPEADCFLLDSAVGQTSVVWPYGTTGTADGPGVVLPDGRTVRVGDVVHGGGGSGGLPREHGIPTECTAGSQAVLIVDGVTQIDRPRDGKAAPATCADIERFSDRIKDVGITYDHPPSQSPEALMDTVDVAFAGHLTGGFASYEDQDGQAAAGYEVDIDLVLKGPEDESLDGVRYAWVAFNPSHVGSGNFQDVNPVGTPVVVFGNFTTRAPGYEVDPVEGFATSCPGGPLLGLFGSQGEWADVSSLDDLIARLEAASDL